MKTVVFLATLMLSANLWAAVKTFKGFVEVASGNELYVEWVAPKEGQPTVVLINGLTYSTRQWDDFTAALLKDGLGVLRYDAFGMGQTLLKYAPITDVVSYKDQLKDLNSLLAELKIAKPYNLVGLSYGGGIAIAYAAQYPQQVKRILALAPFTEPLQSQDTWIKNQVAATRAMQPWNPYSDDELYDYFLRNIIYTTYPSAEPIVLENPYKLEATFRMVQGIRHFRAERVLSKLPKKSLHLIIAAKDQYIPRDVMETFWSKVPADVKASKAIIENSEHKIPEAVPRFSAALVSEIVRGNREFSKGIEVEADPRSGVVTFPDGTMQLPKEK